MTLTEFLLARIAEDEAAVVCCHGAGCPNRDFEFAPGLTDCNQLNVGPRRWLAECEAKRQIVEMHQAKGDRHYPWRNTPSDGFTITVCGECGGTYGSCKTLQILAAPYAEHPDYQQEWRP